MPFVFPLFWKGKRKREWGSLWEVLLLGLWHRCLQQSGVGQAISQEPRTQSNLAVQTKALEPCTLLLHGCTVTGSWNSEQRQGSNTGTAKENAGIPRATLRYYFKYLYLVHITHIYLCWKQIYRFLVSTLKHNFCNSNGYECTTHNKSNSLIASDAIIS